MRFALCLGFVFALAPLPRAGASAVDFATEVQPILAGHCQSCHGGDKRSGGFTIREYTEMLHGGRSGASLIPGDSKHSLLIQRLTGEHAPVMPLGGAPLKPDNIATIAAWIDQGARLTADGPAARAPWVPKLELTAPPVPSSRLTASGQPVDHFIAVYFEQRHVPLPVAVPDAVFARRVYLDVTGLLPSPEALEAFTLDHAPGKRAQLIDRLLADNRNYAAHWISFWNDLLRNDGGDNYHGGRKSITDWLYRALETNLPYTRFVSELLNPSTPAAPDGFLMGVNWRGDVNASQTPVMQAAQNSAQIFLGVNLKCNSCHDSFISRWKLKDAYGLAAFFSENPKLELVRCDNPTGQFTTPSFLYPELNPGSAALPSLSARHAAAARMFTDPRNGRTPRTLVNRYWAKLFGRGLVADVDDLDGEPWNPQLLDWLASDFVAHGSDLKHLLRVILNSQAYQFPSVRRKSAEIKEYAFDGPEVRRISAEQLIDSIGAVTGEWELSLESSQTLARYSRDWKVPASNLSRALGRPVRDQVFTERDRSATTLQALELVNGPMLTDLLNRGAQRLLGQLKPPPANLFDSGRVTSKTAAVDIDISGLDELHLVVVDAGSYSPERVIPLWSDPQVQQNGVWVPLPDPGTLSLGTDKMYDARGKHWTRFRAVASVDKSCQQSVINPGVRFFVFGETPDWTRLIRIAPETPLAPQPALGDPEKLIERLWVQALGRPPAPGERTLALEALQQPGGLADLLWSLILLPEFQLIG